MTPGQKPTNISAASATDAWVGGNDYTGDFAMHYNGSAWSTFQMPAASGQSNVVSSIAARGDQAWAAGTSKDGSHPSPASALWHWDGSTWSSVAFPVNNNLGSATVNYVPGSNTVWVETNDPSESAGC